MALYREGKVEVVDAEGPRTARQGLSTPGQHSLNRMLRIGLEMETPIVQIKVAAAPASRCHALQGLIDGCGTRTKENGSLPRDGARLANTASPVQRQR